MAKHANRSKSRDGVDSNRVGRMAVAEGASGASAGRSPGGWGGGSGASKMRADRAHRGGSRGAGPCPSAAIRAHKEVTVKMLSRFHSRRSGSGLAPYQLPCPRQRQPGRGARDVLRCAGRALRRSVCDQGVGGGSPPFPAHPVTGEGVRDRRHARAMCAMSCSGSSGMSALSSTGSGSSTTTPTIRMPISCSGAKMTRVKT